MINIDMRTVGTSVVIEEREAGGGQAVVGEITVQGRFHTLTFVPQEDGTFLVKFNHGPLLGVIKYNRDENRWTPVCTECDAEINHCDMNFTQYCSGTYDLVEGTIEETYDSEYSDFDNACCPECGETLDGRPFDLSLAAPTITQFITEHIV